MVSNEIQYSTIEMPSKNSEGMTIQLRHARMKDASSLAYMFCTLKKYNSYKFSACEGTKENADNENHETDNNVPLTDLVENIDQIKEDTEEQSSEYKPSQEEHTEIKFHLQFMFTKGVDVYFLLFQGNACCVRII